MPQAQYETCTRAAGEIFRGDLNREGEVTADIGSKQALWVEASSKWRT